LPCKRSETFSTAVDNQSAVALNLFLGESPLAGNNVKLGTFELNGIPAAKAAVPQIQVEFTVDQACGVVALASVQGSEIRAERNFAPPKEFSQKFVDKLLADAAVSHAEDEAKLRQIEAANRANRLIKQAEERLANGPNKSLSSAVAELGLALASDDAKTIREKADALERSLSPSSDLFGD